MKILLISHMAPAFNEFYPFIQYCKKTGLNEPIVYFNHSKDHAAHQVKLCHDFQVVALDQNGLQIVSDQCDEHSDPASDTDNSFFAKAKLSLKKFIKGSRFKPFIVSFLRAIISRLYNPIPDIIYLHDRCRVIKNILKEHKPDAIVLGQDMAHLDTALIIKIAHKKNIPVITLTWIFASGYDPAHVYYNKLVYPEYQASHIINRILLYFFPKYKYTYNGCDIVRLPGMQAFGREILGIGAPLPWVFNSGHSDSIVMESDFMLQFYENAGLPNYKLENIGMPMHDIFANIIKNKENEKNEIYDEYSFDFKKQLLLIGLPPDIFSMKVGCLVSEFNNYDEAVYFWINVIKKFEARYNLLVTVHPGCSITERQTLENKYDISVIRYFHSTSQILPLADFYITSVSSTIRWAISCGIPVIDYFYKVDNQLGNVPGVVKPKDRFEFLTIIQRILTDEHYLQDLAMKQRTIAPKFGKLDGMACKRLHSLLEEKIRSNRSIK